MAGLRKFKRKLLMTEDSPESPGLDTPATRTRGACTRLAPNDDEPSTQPLEASEAPWYPSKGPTSSKAGLDSPATRTRGTRSRLAPSDDEPLLIPPDQQEDQDEPVVEANLNSEASALLPRKKYEEDVYINNHKTVWGSWWKDNQWVTSAASKQLGIATVQVQLELGLQVLQANNCFCS